MSGGVTTGSLLNQRVFKRSTGSSSSGSSGVQRSPLLQTKITLANRNTATRGTSYTALSNAINGRKEVIYVGGDSCCSGTAKMSTAEKIAMYLSLSEQGLQLTQGIASLFSAGKADKAEGTKNTGNSNGNSGVNNSNNDVSVGSNDSQKVNQDLASTVSLVSGDSVISGMENATTSADLNAAIQDAQSYFDGQLTSNYNDAKAGKASAEELLEKFKENDTVKNAKKAVEDAKQNVANAEQGVKAFESKVGKEERNIQEANDALGQADSNYKKACEDTAFGEKSLKQAQKDVASAKQGVQTAQGNVDTAQGKVDSLNMQLTTAAPEQKAAIQAQLAEAKAELATAQQQLNEAKIQQASAEQAEALAENQLKGYQQAEETALKNVDDNKKGVADAKKKLAESKQDLEKAQQQLEAKQKELEANQKTLQSKESKLADIEKQKDDAEAAIEKFEKIEKEYNSLKSEITDQKERLTKMIKDEQKKMDKLDKKIARQEAKSDKAEEKMNLDGQAEAGHDVSGSERRAGRRMDRAEAKEMALRAKKAAIAGAHFSGTFEAAGVSGNTSESAASTDDVSARLDKMASSAHLTGGLALAENVNGHLVSMQNNQFTVDGKSGLTRQQAEELLKA